MTKTKWALLALPALLAVTTCSKPAPDATGAPATAPKLSAADAGSGAAKAISVPQLAYDYSYGFTASTANTETLLKADQAVCDRGGVTQCQMESLTVDADNAAGFTEKTLELRVTPDWLKTWQAGLAAELTQSHGKISEQKVSSEDLSLQVVDTEAHLKNKEALRDRMLEIVHTGKGKLSDLIDVENQLSQVQTDIDATQSALAVMQKRIATVHLTLTYRGDAAPAVDSAFAPVTGALKSSLGVTMQVVALIISLIAAVLPVALLALPAFWLVRKRMAGAAKSPPPALADRPGPTA